MAGERKQYTAEFKQEAVQLLTQGASGHVLHGQPRRVRGQIRVDEADDEVEVELTHARLRNGNQPR